MTEVAFAVAARADVRYRLPGPLGDWPIGVTPMRHANRPLSRPAVYVARVRAYLDTVPTHHVGVPELAKMAGVSSSQLAHAFRAQVGLAPLTYLTRARVEKATALLRAGVRPAVAAVDVGFHDQSHLHRHVKRFTGLTPARYAGLHSSANTGGPSQGPVHGSGRT